MRGVMELLELVPYFTFLVQHGFFDIVPPPRHLHRPLLVPIFSPSSGYCTSTVMLLCDGTILYFYAFRFPNFVTFPISFIVVS